jgi:hypothetical protein
MLSGRMRSIKSTPTLVILGKGRLVFDAKNTKSAGLDLIKEWFKPV